MPIITSVKKMGNNDFPLINHFLNLSFCQLCFSNSLNYPFF